jgi:hypothetical protein
VSSLHVENQKQISFHNKKISKTKTFSLSNNNNNNIHSSFPHLTTKSSILIYLTLNKLFFFYYFTHNRFSSPPLLKFETLSSVSTTISSRFIKNQFHLLHLHCSSIPFEKSLISSPIYKNPNSQFENPNQFHRFCSIRFHVRLCFSSISVRFYLCSIRKPKPVFHVRFCFCVRL